MMAANLKKMKFTSRRILQQSHNPNYVHIFCKAYTIRKTKLSTVSTNQRILHVLSGDEIALTVRCPGGVQDACICTVEPSRVYLLILGPSGDIFRTELPSTLTDSGSKDSRTDQDASVVDSDSIFDDLLQAEGSTESRDAIVVLKTEDIILRQPGVKRLASMGEYMVTVVQSTIAYRLHVYRWVNDDSHTGRMEQISTICVDNLSGESEPSHTMGAKLCFVCPTESPFSVQNTAEHLWLDRPLFGQLFGSQYGLLETPVLLFGTPSGHLYAIPLYHPPSSQNKSEPRVVCDLQQPVAAIYSLRLPTENNDGENRLCIIGYNGKVLSLAHSQGQQCNSKEYYISSPVVCSVKLGLDIVHCTGSQFLVTDFRQLVENEVYSHLQSEIYSAGLTLSMAAYGDNDSQTREWLSVTKTGHVYQHTLSEVTTGAANNPLTTHRSHSSLKDLLTGISHSAEQLLRAQQQVVSLDSLLTQLALAAYISQNPTKCTDRNANCCPLKFTASVDLQNLGPETMTSLRVCLLNASGVRLTAGWVLTVMISAKTSVDSSWSWPGNMSRSTPLVNQLAPGQSQDVIFPLTQAHLASLPLSVDGFVTYYPVAPHCSTAPVTLPIGSEVIDILYCLDAEQLSMQLATLHASNAEQSLSEIAKSRPCWNLGRSQLIMDDLQPRTGTRNMKTFVTESRLPSAKQKELPPEVRLLHLLLADSDIKIPDSGTQVMSCSVAGNHQVSILVKRAAGDRLEVCWGSDDMRTVGWLHTAITARLQNLGKYCDVPHGNTLIQKYEEVGQQAHTLRDRTCEAGHSRHQSAKDTMSLYAMLRDMVL